MSQFEKKVKEIMTVEEKKETIRQLDKMMLDSVNLISEAKDRTEGQVVTRFLSDMLEDRSKMLKKLDQMEVKLRAEMPNNEQVGGSVQATFLDDDLEDKEVLREVLNGSRDLLEVMEKEMSKPISDEMKSVLEESSRELIRHTETMKKMIEKDEV